MLYSYSFILNNNFNPLLHLNRYQCNPKEMQVVSSTLSPIGSPFFCKTDTGLGNALFQIASIYGISKKLGVRCAFPRLKLYIDALHSLHYNHGETILRNVPSWGDDISFDILTEQFLGDGVEYNKRYNEGLVKLIQNSQNNVMVRGHLEDYKYFEDVVEDVKEMFSCDPLTRAKIDERYGELLKGNSVAIHFRDYSKVNNPFLAIVPDFYKRAIQYIKERVDSPHFLLFTDNRGCVDLSILDGCTYTFIENEVDYMDLYCMSLCKHAIISQSTFSWWACFLNANPEKIVLYDSKYPYNYLKMFTSI